MKLTLQFPGGSREVDGIVVDIAPHIPGEQFAVHREFIWDNPDIDAYLLDWVVSHVGTGMRVHVDTQKREAVEGARQKLATQTPETMATAIEKGRKMIADFQSKRTFEFGP